MISICIQGGKVEDIMDSDIMNKPKKLRKDYSKRDIDFLEIQLGPGIIYMCPANPSINPESAL